MVEVAGSASISAGLASSGGRQAGPCPRRYRQPTSWPVTLTLTTLKFGLHTRRAITGPRANGPEDSCATAVDRDQITRSGTRADKGRCFPTSNSNGTVSSTVPSPVSSVDILGGYSKRRTLPYRRSLCSYRRERVGVEPSGLRHLRRSEAANGRLLRERWLWPPSEHGLNLHDSPALVRGKCAASHYAFWNSAYRRGADGSAASNDLPIA